MLEIYERDDIKLTMYYSSTDDRYVIRVIAPGKQLKTILSVKDEHLALRTFERMQILINYVVNV
jgi:hypothetical protein